MKLFIEYIEKVENMEKLKKIILQKPKFEPKNAEQGSQCEQRLVRQ